nr:hypothetical protein [Tanacetum cinerariifolium]
MNTTSTSGSGSLPGNTVANPKGELKAITTRSGLVTNGPAVPTPPKSVTLEEDECVEETYTDPDLAEYTIKVPPPPDFSRDDDLPSPDNEDKVFNPILIQEKSVTIITRVAQEKKLAIYYASLVFEDFDPLFYEPIVFKDVPNSMRLLPFSSENEEKVFKPGIYTSKKKPNDTFNKAWERFKDLLRQCPHHGGNFLDKIPREYLSIIESKSKVRYSRSRITDSRANTNAPLSSFSPSNSFDL